MEEELKCPSCRLFLNEPILLHCAHSYCRQCAIRKQVKVSTIGSTSNNNSSILPNSQLSSPPSSSGYFIYYFKYFFLFYIYIQFSFGRLLKI